MNYSALREGGMQFIRKWASESWTDHNVHDPGITILEACSYAMTELGLRLQLNVVDLLRSGESNAVPDLEPTHRVLPIGPVNAEDLRRVLLDHPLVNDAQLFLAASSEVPFYEAPGANPPLTFTPGTPRVRPGGLYEVLVELADRELNSNTYSLQVTSGGLVGQPTLTYDIDLALPFWDEPEAAPFRESVVISAIDMVVEGGEVWRALPEPQSYFGKLNVAYTGASGAASIVIWILLRITTPLAQPTAVAPGILIAARSAVESTAAGSPLDRFGSRARRAAAAVDQLRNNLADWRNLGEQAVRIGVARIQEIAVRARVEVTGGIDVEQLLAGIFADIDGMLSPRVRFESLPSRRMAESDPARIYDGPLLRNGFLSKDTLSATHPAVLYVSDLLRLIMQRRGGARTDLVTQENPVGRDIVAVTDLAFANFINNRPITSEAEDCLHLVEIERYRPRLSIAKSRVVTVRDDSEVNYSLARVERLFADLLAQAAAGSTTADTSPVWPVSRGDLLPVEQYTPLQDDLPRNYGVGYSVLPDSAGPERRAAVRQLQGYLLLFEQFLSDATAQLGNVNRFFAADAEEQRTYFTSPLFDLPGVPSLLKRFPLGGDWSAFVADPNNPVARALHDAAENPERFLDRRNRMLDHLLARQGEDTVAFGQELHRWAQEELGAVNLPVDQQLARMAARRGAANARLIRTKAALLHDVPELNGFRLLANSNPLYRDFKLLRIEETAGAFRWHLRLLGQDLLHSAATFATTAAAAVAAENALAFAGRSALYVVVDIGGGQRRLRLMNGSTADAETLAESSQTWNNVADANAALVEISAAFATFRLESSLSPMERRIAYLTGIRSQQRRRLLVQTNVHFEIVDDPPGGGSFGKRWRLRELPGITGQVLLNSLGRFEAATDPLAIDLAQQSIRQVLRYGIDEWNYRISAAAGNTFTYQLQDPAGTTLAIRDTGLPSRADAEQALAATVDHLYRTYSAEGLFLIEHLLLRPRLPGQPFLSLPLSNAARERDPYSQRISVILPSGYARDFALPHQSAPVTPATPDRFRDLEFRRHAERMIQQACPAHLMPTIYWVDRQATGSFPSTASFDAFEQRYFEWLDTVLIAGAPIATIDSARTALVEALNAVANDAA